MRIRLVRKLAARLPKLYLPDTLLTRIGQVVEGNILDNIAKQQQFTGAALKRNRPATVRRKRAAGQTHLGKILSLVAALKRFVRPRGGSWKTSISRRDNSAIIAVTPATAELATISGYVQRMGYVGWFAISKGGMTAIRAVIQEWIKSQFRSPRASV